MTTLTRTGCMSHTVTPVPYAPVGPTVHQAPRQGTGQRLFEHGNVERDQRPAGSTQCHKYHQWRSSRCCMASSAPRQRQTRALHQSRPTTRGIQRAAAPGNRRGRSQRGRLSLAHGDLGAVERHVALNGLGAALGIGVVPCRVLFGGAARAKPLKGTCGGRATSFSYPRCQTAQESHTVQRSHARCTNLPGLTCRPLQRCSSSRLPSTRRWCAATTADASRGVSGLDMAHGRVSSVVTRWR